MEELSLEVTIIGVALCIAGIIFLAAEDNLIKMLRRSPKLSKTK